MMAGAQIKRFLVLHKELDADDGEMTRTAEGAPLRWQRALRPLIDALYDGSREIDRDRGDLRGWPQGCDPGDV
jgi:long-chain acyl-CoA synthetase